MVTLNRELQELLDMLVKEFPQLNGLKSDLSDETEWEAMSKINGLHKAISHRLKALTEQPVKETSTSAVFGVQQPTELVPAVSGQEEVDEECHGKEQVEPEELTKLLRFKKQIDPKGHYIGESLAILRVFERIDRYNHEPEKPVLILGPTGSGKSEIAELIHGSSSRNAMHFHREQAADNMASDMAIVKGRWVGYGKGSGLAALSRDGSLGVLQQCIGGTIFVDEMADLPHTMQTFLLDVLDGKAIPVTAGQGPPIKPDVRLIFATNADIDEAERTGKLRRDFMRRLRNYILTIPPLKDRKEDILLFVQRMCEDRRPSPEFLLCLLRYDWPGNIGELKDVLEKARTSSTENELLSIDHLELVDPTVVDAVCRLPPQSIEKEVYEALADLFRRQGFTKHKGLFKKMAQFLDISEATMSRKAQEFLSPQE